LFAIISITPFTFAPAYYSFCVNIYLSSTLYTILVLGLIWFIPYFNSKTKQRAIEHTSAENRARVKLDFKNLPA